MSGIGGFNNFKAFSNLKNTKAALEQKIENKAKQGKLSALGQQKSDVEKQLKMIKSDGIPDFLQISQIKRLERQLKDINSAMDDASPIKDKNKNAGMSLQDAKANLDAVEKELGKYQQELKCAKEEAKTANKALETAKEDYNNYAAKYGENSYEAISRKKILDDRQTKVDQANSKVENCEQAVAKYEGGVITARNNYASLCEGR